MSRNSVPSCVVLLAVLAACGAPTAAPAPTAAVESSGGAAAEEKIANAMSAMPPDLAAHATIVDYAAEAGKPPVMLREGTNGWTCFPDWEASPGNDPQCFDAVWMAWFDALNSGTAPKTATLGLAYMLEGGSDASNTDPFAAAPENGGEWISSPPHIMLIAPGKFDPSYYENSHHSGEPYVMWAGTPYEHMMVPVAVDAASRLEDKQESALSALPEALRANATVVDFAAEAGKPPVMIREGTSTWTCFPDWDATPGNDPACYDTAWMRWLDALNAGSEPNNTAVAVSYMLQGGQDASNTDPFAVAPPEGADWVDSPPHVMVLSPVKLDPAQFSTDHHSGEPYVMFAGTPYEHIMMPVR